MTGSSTPNLSRRRTLERMVDERVQPENDRRRRTGPLRWYDHPAYSRKLAENPERAYPRLRPLVELPSRTRSAVKSSSPSQERWLPKEIVIIPDYYRRFKPEPSGFAEGRGTWSNEYRIKQAMEDFDKLLSNIARAHSMLRDEGGEILKDLGEESVHYTLYDIIRGVRMEMPWGGYFSGLESNPALRRLGTYIRQGYTISFNRPMYTDQAWELRKKDGDKVLYSTGIWLDNMNELADILDEYGESLVVYSGQEAINEWCVQVICGNGIQLPGNHALPQAFRVLKGKEAELETQMDMETIPAGNQKEPLVRRFKDRTKAIFGVSSPPSRERGRVGADRFVPPRRSSDDSTESERIFSQRRSLPRLIRRASEKARGKKQRRSTVSYRRGR